ncbi:histone-lysine N-methyltransferase [Candidatus Poribacteria bacterium]|nr:histone-lysine N-methyltransferase [Candidatus Poribacteria bacterium]
MQLNKINKAKVLLKTNFTDCSIDYVEEPNLLRDIYPYDSVPRIQFDYKIVPLDPAEDMFITDTTFRDGQQARTPYTTEQVLDLFDFLNRLGGPNGIIRRSEFFLYSDRDKETVRRCMAREYKYPEITGWIRATKGDLELVKQMGLKETGLLMSISDYHVFLKLGKDRKQATYDYLEVVDAALENNIIPRCHLEDITRADFCGYVIPFVQMLMKRSDESGIPIKIRACDTLGYGVTYPGAALPRSVPKMMNALINEAGVPPENLEWHGHNDFHKVHINAATAWLYGCSAANGTLLGFGERTGNPPIESLIMEYIGLKGETNGINTSVITEIANYFQTELKTRIPENYPFVGSEFNTTRAGIHADGVLKNPEIYTIFNTGKILNRPVDVTISDKSGLAGVAYWVNSHLELEGDDKLDKRHPGVVRIYEWVENQYKVGRITGISSAEMLLQARKFLPDLFESDLDKLKQKASDIAVHLVEQVAELLDIRSMNNQKQEAIMQKLIDENPFIQWIYITDLKGNMVTHVIVHPEDQAKYATVSENDNFSDRPWFIGPLKDGKVHVTDFYSSKYTGALCITVSAPIRSQLEKIVGIIGVDIRFEELVKLEEQE